MILHVPGQFITGHDMRPYPSMSTRWSSCVSLVSDWTLLDNNGVNGNHTDVFTWIDLWSTFIICAVMVWAQLKSHTGFEHHRTMSGSVINLLLIMDEQHELDFSIHDINSNFFFFQFSGDITIDLLWPDDQPPILRFKVKIRLKKRPSLYRIVGI